MKRFVIVGTIRGDPVPDDDEAYAMPSAKAVNIEFLPFQSMPNDGGDLTAFLGDDDLNMDDSIL